MVKLRKTLYWAVDKKCLKVSETEKEYESLHIALSECYLEVFHMPASMELSLQTTGKNSREIAVFFGMNGELEGVE